MLEGAIDRSIPDRTNLPDRVLFIDSEAMVLDKPAGLPVDRPKAGGDCIAGRLDELRFGFHRPPVPLHRLDRDTSGCLLLARNPKAMARFARTFEAGLVEKVYVAVIDGEIGGEGMIDLPLAKVSSAEEGWRVVADDRGKPARTRWKALRVRDGRTLVEFRPETGRTHQIRAHARYGLGRPIAGDPVYGEGGEPMLLHALRLAVPREKKPPIEAEAPLPGHFEGWGDAA